MGEQEGKKRAESVEAVLAKHSPEVRAVVERLRALIQTTAPQLTEQVHMGWGAILYGSTGGMANQVVAIAPLRAHANLGLSDGVDLPDPRGLLEGTGKRIRHVKIKTPEDVDRPEVRELIEAAVARRSRGHRLPAPPPQGQGGRGQA